MIEAMATGTPVVATPRGSVGEIVEEGRTGFIRSTPDELAEALRQASQLDRRACRTAVETRFSSQRMAADYVELFEDMLRPWSRPPRAGAARTAAVSD